MQPLEPVNPDDGCGSVILTEGDRVWRCAQDACDGEHHYYRRLTWVGPFYERDTGPPPDE